ncbi:MAG: hypothetical protein M2R45_00908 [Verrucomicrobia subdivision 3 bacterium]|nr:hypothetical protein [Limisphaerales bacterium]MCS1414577.1 hypothetical protein [Limisphaerales bacterium]
MSQLGIAGGTLFVLGVTVELLKKLNRKAMRINELA